MKLFLKISGIRQFHALKSLLPNHNAEVQKIIRALHEDDNYVDYQPNLETNRELSARRKELFFDERELAQVVKGVYFGSDTCEHLLPYFRHVTEVMEHCQRYKLHFVFVFPPISSTYSKHADEMLSFLDGHQAEVVINDYGMLAAASAYNQLKVSLGRLLNRVQRNAFVDNLRPTEVTAEQWENQRQANSQLELAIPEVRSYFKSLNVGRFAIENMQYDDSFFNDAPRMNVDVYYPYIYLSSSRACDTAGVVDHIYAHFPQKECARHCERVSIDFDEGWIFGMIHRNNAFYRVEKKIKIAESIYKKARNRLIYEIWI